MKQNLRYTNLGQKFVKMLENKNTEDLTGNFINKLYEELLSVDILA